MKNEIGWNFPPTNGGIGTGINDPGMAHFTGQPLESLARETIQNSLDARLDHDQPVHVSFEVLEFDLDKVGRNELKIAIESCKLQVDIESDSTDAAALREAGESVEAKQIPCLRISDRNTTGLIGENWRALVKMQGLSHKPDVQGAGGSHGIGKYAPFSVSTLRTVFYWTCFSDSGAKLEKMQGKSVLISHMDSNNEETQGTGFFGIRHKCGELTEQIPEIFRITDENEQPVTGTSVTVMGFREVQGWQERIAASVIRSFFYAIGNGQLTVIVEPDDESNLMEMNQNSIDDWFKHLQDLDSLDEAGVSDSVRNAKIFWELSRGEPFAEKQDGDLGHCRLWISTAEGLPKKAAFVRCTGMLVTTAQSGLLHFPSYKDFAALCVFEDPKGNELLRRMENPKHDQFEPNRLPKDERERGRKALKRITDWVRSEIRKCAGPPEGGKKTILSELAVYLPDFQPEEAFETSAHEDESNGEPGFGSKVQISLKPIRRPTLPKIPEGDDIEIEGDGDDTGIEGGAGTGGNGNGSGNGGTGEGDGIGGSGTRGGSTNRQIVPVASVRILPITGKENHYQLSFLAERDGIVRLTLDEAGDSSAMPRTDVYAVDGDKSLDQVHVKRGQRTSIDISAEGPIDDRAWRLSAVAASTGDPI